MDSNAPFLRPHRSYLPTGKPRPQVRGAKELEAVYNREIWRPCLSDRRHRVSSTAMVVDPGAHVSVRAAG
jgi:hypothetical protein